MKHLFDFGISQEDPVTEYNLLDIQSSDKVLCVASGGEMPLSLLCFQPGVTITAVDISSPQLILCRLKMQSAILLAFPGNGQFLGYAGADKRWRRKTYLDLIHPKLPKDDQSFWMGNLRAIESGVVNLGRFEGYIRRIRIIIGLIVGKRNIDKLLCCSTLSEQENVFDKYIGKRKSVQYLFRIAFHPAIYRNRGLNSQGLIHTEVKMGEIFYNKFRNFCTRTPVSRNYFLQYYLAGACQHEAAFPEYLQERFRVKLALNYGKINWKQKSLQQEMAESAAGTYDKIHLSNIGDWMSEEDFSAFMHMLCRQTTGQEKICYRFLQKNHFLKGELCNNRFAVNYSNTENKDRFPFYSVLTIQGHE